MTGEPMRRLVGNKWLRCGYTTGTCAAAAAKAAATMLLSGQLVESVTVQTPSGVTLTLDVLDARCDGVTASGAVRKDAGDDPDATDGALIYAHVERTATAAIVIDGGEGIGRVTKPGLDQPVGAAAINSVPRSMIEAAVHSAEAESIEVREMKIASISEPIEIHGRRKSETESNEACDRKRSDRTASVAELVKSEAASIDSAESPQSPELSGWRVVISCPTGAEIVQPEARHHRGHLYLGDHRHCRTNE